MSRITLAVSALLLLLGRAAAGPSFDTLSDSLRAVESGSVSEYTESGVTRYVRTFGDLFYGQWYSIYPPAQGSEHGTTAFNLSRIPDTALVLAAEFGFFQLTDDTAGTPQYYVRAYDYAGVDPESLFNAVDTADTVSSLYEAHHGWNRVPLTEAGAEWIRARLASNRCRLAIAEEAWGEQAEGYGTAWLSAPHLSVSYLPAAAEERSTPAAPCLTLEITPNPCRSIATVRLCGSSFIPHPSSLAVYDPSGRLVLSQPVRASSFILRTSSLSAGVYVARCPSGDRVASARFTVLHR